MCWGDNPFFLNGLRGFPNTLTQRFGKLRPPASCCGFLTQPKSTGARVGDSSVRLPQSGAPTVCGDCLQYPKSMFNGGLSPGMLYRDMQLQGLGYSPSTGKGSVAGDKKVAPGRVVCVLSCGLPAHPQACLTKLPLLGSGSQPITSQIGAAVLTRQEKHTPSSCRCRYPILIRQREGS